MSFHSDAAEEHLQAAREGFDLIKGGTDEDRAAAVQYALLGIGHAILHLADNVYQLTLPEDQRG
jgi:hypothetical protein